MANIESYWIDISSDIEEIENKSVKLDEREHAILTARKEIYDELTEIHKTIDERERDLLAKITLLKSERAKLLELKYDVEHKLKDIDNN